MRFNFLRVVNTSCQCKYIRPASETFELHFYQSIKKTYEKEKNITVFE
jgi:hypothetical protein